MGPYKTSFLYNACRVIVHFHDYGRKGSSIIMFCSKISISVLSNFMLQHAVVGSNVCYGMKNDVWFKTCFFSKKSYGFYHGKSQIFTTIWENMFFFNLFQALDNKQLQGPMFGSRCFNERVFPIILASLTKWLWDS